MPPVADLLYRTRGEFSPISGESLDILTRNPYSINIFNGSVSCIKSESMRIASISDNLARGLPFCRHLGRGDSERTHP